MEKNHNLINLFLEDHRALKEIVQQMHDTQSDSSIKYQLLISFSKILDRHTYEEETFLYPVVKKFPELRPEALEGWEEHKMIGQLIAEMKTLNLSDERWTAKFKVMSETLAHHLKEEETELFPGALEKMEKSQLAEYGRKAAESRLL